MGGEEKRVKNEMKLIAGSQVSVSRMFDILQEIHVNSRRRTEYRSLSSRFYAISHGC